jgi:anti-sigma factor RsiW
MTPGPDRNSPIDEQLSAWLDDELPAPELELFATRLAGSPELRARVARYGLIGSTLRGGAAGGNFPGLAALRMSGRVGAALDDPVNAVAFVPASARPLRRLLPYAAAAAVALLAVGLVPFLGLFSGPAAPPAAGLPAQASGVLASGSLVRVRSPITGDPWVRSEGSLSPGRLTSYLVYHGEYSGMLAAKLPDSHIVNNRAYAAALRTAEQPAPR